MRQFHASLDTLHLDHMAVVDRYLCKFVTDMGMGTRGELDARWLCELSIGGGPRDPLL
jgi:hypothetical protein